MDNEMFCALPYTNMILANKFRERTEDCRRIFEPNKNTFNVMDKTSSDGA